MEKEIGFPITNNYTEIRLSSMEITPSMAKKWLEGDHDCGAWYYGNVTPAEARGAVPACGGFYHSTTMQKDYRFLNIYQNEIIEGEIDSTLCGVHAEKIRALLKKSPTKNTCGWKGCEERFEIRKFQSTVLPEGWRRISLYYEPILGGQTFHRIDGVLCSVHLIELAQYLILGWRLGTKDILDNAKRQLEKATETVKNE